MADPLGGTPQSISPFAPRSPLPGQHSYRAQPLPPPPNNSAWSSPPSTPQPHNGQAHPQAHAPGGWAGSSSQASSAGSARGGMTPRSPQGQGYERRSLGETSDDLGQNGGASAAGEGRSGEGAAVRAEPSVRVRVTGLDRNRRDFFVKFNAESNLPTFRNSIYRSVSRSYSEFQKLADALGATCPQSVIPALPLPDTSAATHDEDDRLVKLAFQMWFARVTADAAVVRDDELRSFVESDFGYNPSSKAKRRMPSAFYFPKGSRAADEADDSLTVAKGHVGRLELGLAETAKTIERVAKARRSVAVACVDVGEHLASFASTEAYAPLAGGINKLARTTKLNADILAAQATAEQVTLGDLVSYQAANARAAKETLLARDVILDEHRSAAKATVAKRKAIEKLKGANNIKADRVDEALDELDDAKKHEQLLAQRLAAISTNLQPSLRAHQKHVNEDILAALLEHARVNLQHEKQLLKEVELLRPQLAGIQKPQAGVIYHTSPNPNPQRVAAGGAGGAPSPTMARQGSAGSFANGSPVQARPPLGASVGSSHSVHSVRGSPFGAPPKGLDDPLLGSKGNAPPKRSVRQMAQSVMVEGDRRQRVDDRMAASLLANGF